MNDRLNRLAGLAAVALVASVGIAPVARAAADPAFGEWLVQAKNGRVRVAPCVANPAQACGTIVSGVAPPDAPPGPPRDLNNPDPALRGRPLIGLLVIRDFTRTSEGHWDGGAIYEPDTGKTYKAKMVAAPDGTLKVSGCVLIFCKAQTWTRTAP